MSDRPAATDDEQVPEYDEAPEDASRAEHSRAEKGAVISIADLVGARVVTHDSKARGRVTDVVIAPPPDLQIVALVVGASGWLHRLRIVPIVRAATGRRTTIDEIPWQGVDRWDGLEILLRPEASTEGVEER